MTRLKNVVSVSPVDSLKARLEDERRKGLVAGNHGYSDAIILDVGSWARQENLKGRTYKELGSLLGVSAGTVSKCIKTCLFAREVRPTPPKPSPIEARRKCLWALLEGAKQRQDVDSAIEILRMIGELPNVR